MEQAATVAPAIASAASRAPGGGGGGSSTKSAGRGDDSLMRRHILDAIEQQEKRTVRRKPLRLVVVEVQLPRLEQIVKEPTLQQVKQMAEEMLPQKSMAQLLETREVTDERQWTAKCLHVHGGEPAEDLHLGRLGRRRSPCLREVAGDRQRNWKRVET
ncbi:hypothetical protein OsJ_23278 [Oryza sativa Japonica Group]|uniref:Uncharacterized protein n=1 Tax=Oryza sativa subsp. japonica TaxID=39947 RepID=B9FVR8_ORYSJ|nr:hypothetical protein OsJ_23278 [Oryza sativa Japonica Group]